VAADTFFTSAISAGLALSAALSVLAAHAVMDNILSMAMTPVNANFISKPFKKINHYK
jgi:hypothetical protein